MYLQMKTILLTGWFALMVGMLCTDAIFTRCMQGWTYYNHSCYIKSIQRETWIEAYKECESLNAQLLVLNFKEETDYIMEIQQASPMTWLNMKWLWLGCKERDGMRVCSDDNKQQLTMLNEQWQCTVLKPFTSSEPMGDHCSLRRRFACEKQEEVRGSVRCQVVSKQDANLMTTPYCLLGHAYMVTPIKHPIQCCIACGKDPNCRSFNLSGKMCHLNNVTISQVDADKFVTTVESCANYILD